MFQHRVRWGLVILALISITAIVVARSFRDVQIPSLPWAGRIESIEHWPLLVQSPDRARIDFDLKWRGLLIQGEDWLPKKRRSRLHVWSFEHWAAQRPTVYFVTPGPGGLRLTLSIGRRSLNSTSLQTFLNDHEMTILNLSAGDCNLEIDLPETALVPGINRLRFVFGDAPTVQAPGAAVHIEQRAAALRAISLRQRGVQPSSIERGNIRLHVASPMSIPVSGTPRSALHLEVLEAPDPAEFTLRACIAGQAPKILIEDSIKTGQIIEINTPEHGFGNFELSLSGRPGTSAKLRLVKKDISSPDDLSGIPSLPARANPDTRPHIFLYVVDTLRADAVDLGDAQSSPTSNLARFAADAVVFERAWSPSSWTRPSTEALLTGTYAGSAHTPHNWIAPILSETGYETLAISQSFVVNQQRFGTGFETFYASDSLSRGTNEGQMVSWFLWHHLNARRDLRPLFTYIHTIDPHGPYTPYREDRRHMSWWTGWRPHRFDPSVVLREDRVNDVRTLAMMRDLYAGDVRHADRSFGAFIELLRFTGLYDDSVIILCSDHGEAFGEHHTVGHGKSVYEEQLRVPLMIKLPHNERGGSRVDTRVSTVAAAPSIFGLAGLPGSPHFSDRSLLGTEVEARIIRAHQTRRPRKPETRIVFDAAIENELKCISTVSRAGGRQLEAYDLKSDPEELTLLRDPKMLQRCRELLHAALSDDPSPIDEPEEPAEIQQRLEALGYIDQS